MQTVQNLLNSISVEQWALAIGSLTWLAHSVCARNKGFSKPINLFITRSTTLVLPLATAIATDPHVSGLVHNYFPALLGFFTAYQGLYQLMKAASAKWDQLRTMANPVQDQTA